MKEIQTDKLCDYGCGHVAKYEMSNGKLCCSKSPNSCEANRKKNANGSLKDRICPHCQQEFKQISGRIFANHVRWCEKNPKHDEICGKSLAEKQRHAMQNMMINKHGNKKEFHVKCHTCQKDFIIVEYEKKFPSKERYFCSKHCAYQYSASQTNPENIRIGRKKFDDENPGYWSMVAQKHNFCKRFGIKKDNTDFIPAVYEKRICKWCNKEFSVKHTSLQKCCSNSCASKFKNFKLYQEKLNAATSDAERIKIRLRRYRQQCAFQFALKDYPDEFDFKLIEQYGWYKAKNHGNNPNGVSRDHMYSVVDGFLNNVDPLIVAHPANCRLIRQSENASKKNKSCITLDELKERIRIWNEKYTS